MAILRLILSMFIFFQINTLHAMDEKEGDVKPPVSTFKVGSTSTIDSIKTLKEWIPFIAKGRTVKFVSDVDETVTLPTILLLNAEIQRDFVKQYTTLYESLGIPEAQGNIMAKLLHFSSSYAVDLLKDGYFRLTEEEWEDVFKICGETPSLEFLFVSGRNCLERNAFLRTKFKDAEIITLEPKQSKAPHILKRFRKDLRKEAEKNPVIVFIDNNSIVVNNVMNYFNRLLKKGTYAFEPYCFHYTHTVNRIDSERNTLRYQLLSLLEGTGLYTSLTKNILARSSLDNSSIIYDLKIKISKTSYDRDVLSSIMDHKIPKEGLSETVSRKLEAIKNEKEPEPSSSEEEEEAESEYESEYESDDESPAALSLTPEQERGEI